jgi:hypothetical protein
MAMAGGGGDSHRVRSIWRSAAEKRGCFIQAPRDLIWIKVLNAFADKYSSAALRSVLKVVLI